MSAIRFAAAAFLFLPALAQAQAEYQPAEAGTWYLSGGSSALFQSVSGGDFGDSKVLGLSVSGGYFVADGLLLLGSVEATSATQDSGDLELDESSTTFALGLRYYFIQDAVARPYLGAAIGLQSLDQEIDNGAQGILSDSDSYSVMRGEVGLELMIARSIGIDLGLVVEQANSPQLFGVQDDVTSTGLVIGVSAWL